MREELLKNRVGTITADLYAHVRPAMLQAAGDPLNDLIENHG